MQNYTLAELKFAQLKESFPNTKWFEASHSVNNAFVIHCNQDVFESLLSLYKPNAAFYNLIEDTLDIWIPEDFEESFEEEWCTKMQHPDNRYFSEYKASAKESFLRDLETQSNWLSKYPAYLDDDTISGHATVIVVFFVDNGVAYVSSINDPDLELWKSWQSKAFNLPYDSRFAVLEATKKAKDWVQKKCDEFEFDMKNNPSFLTLKSQSQRKSYVDSFCFSLKEENPDAIELSPPIKTTLYSLAESIYQLRSKKS